MKRRHSKAGHEQKFTGMKASTIQYLGVAAVILAGVILGAVLAQRSGIEKKSDFGILMQQMLSKEAAAKGFLRLFASSFLSTAMLLCIAFVLGLCAVGAPGHIGVSLFKGAGIGLSMAFVYMQYGFKGLGICALFILPWAVITSFSIMIACREGIRFSLLMGRAVLPVGAVPHMWNEFSNYCFKYVFCFVLALIAAVIEALSTIAFSMLFF